MKFFARVPKINFMAQRRTGLIVSLVLTAASIALVLTRGLNLGIDFTGGVLVEVSYPQSVELETVRDDLKKGGFEHAIAQYFGSTTAVLIRLPIAHTAEGEANSAQISTQVLKALDAGGQKTELRRIEFVG